MRCIITLVMLIFLVPSVANAFTPSKTDMYWLTQNIYHEARGESNYGKVIVGIVTLQRLEDGRWGNTIKKVVTAKHQFSWYWDGKSDIPKNEKAWEECKLMAYIAIGIQNLFEGKSLLYYHDSKVSPKWRLAMEQILVVDNHIFYLDP